MFLRTLRRTLAVLPVVSLLVAGGPTTTAGAADEPAWHRIHFPVREKVSYSDDWGAARAGGRTHQGNDLMGSKLFHELAAADGVVQWVKVDQGTGSSGNMLSLKGDDGWVYWYIHINNDTPGTDDAANP